MQAFVSAAALSEQLTLNKIPANPVNVIFCAAALGLDEAELDRIADELADEQERHTEH
jgi:hypothetical protein